MSGGVQGPLDCADSLILLLLSRRGLLKAYADFSFTLGI